VESDWFGKMYKVQAVTFGLQEMLRKGRKLGEERGVLRKDIGL